MRPVLKPALHRLWRDPLTLQLGVDPRHARLVSGVDLVDSTLLDLLDGSRTEAGVLAEASRLGHDLSRVHRLLDLLTAADALDDAQGAPLVPAPLDPRLEPDLLSLSLLHPLPGEPRRILAQRADSCVAVHGAGRVGASVAGLLSAAGVGAVAITDTGVPRPADLAPAGIRAGATTGVADRAAAARSAGGARGGPAPRVRCAVLAPVTCVVPPEQVASVRALPHLPVVVRETTAVIGPLVLPGLTACLRCVELGRGERDPSWPSLTAQLVGSPHRVEPCDVTLATLAAALAVSQLLAWLDGGPVAATACDAVLEFALDDLRLRRRTVRPHPLCGCGAEC